MKKVISICTFIMAGSLFGETNILLQNAKMHVELSPSIFYLPVVIRSVDGENILPEHDTFRAIYTYKDEGKNVISADEDNRNEKAYQLVSSSAAGEKPVACVMKDLLPKDKINDALKLHAKSVALNPMGPFHHSSFADTYVYLDDFTNALKHYERSLELLRSPETSQANKKKYIPIYEKKTNELSLRLREKQ